jgi:hypothetical protein
VTRFPDCDAKWHATYVKTTCVLRLKGNDGLAAQLNLGAVLRPEPRHNFDAVRHDGSRGCYPGPIICPRTSAVAKLWQSSCVFKLIQRAEVVDKTGSRKSVSKSPADRSRVRGNRAMLDREGDHVTCERYSGKR